MKKLFFVLMMLFITGTLAVHTAIADELVLPAGLKTIEAEAFMGDTSLDEVILPDGLESIGEKAFANSSVKRVYLPESLNAISDNAFSGCTEIVGYGPDNTYASKYFIENGISFEHEQEEWISSPLEDFVFEDLSETTCKLYSYKGKDSEVVIPKQDASGKYVVEIGKYSFNSNRTITSVRIPNSVTSIENGEPEAVGGMKIPTPSSGCAFGFCINLENIEIPNSVTNIGDFAFAYCESLKSIEIPSSVTRIGEEAFCVCKNLTCVTLPSSITRIETGTFHSCFSLETIDIPSSVTSIETDAFIYCKKLSKVVIPANVTSIGSGAFFSCKELKSIEILSNVTSIGNRAFKYCDNLTIHGEAGSYAEQYAKANSIPFATINPVKYRALLIGEVNFWDPNKKATRNQADAEHMFKMLENVNENEDDDGDEMVYIKKCIDVTKEKMGEKIADVFGQADNNDITIFFIASHGSPSNGDIALTDQLISLDDLAKELKKYRGTKILLLETCGAGWSIEMGCFPYPEFYVITGGTEEEYTGGFEGGPFNGNFFTWAMYDAIKYSGHMPADKSPKDGTVTINEFFIYVQNRTYDLSDNLLYNLKHPPHIPSKNFPDDDDLVLFWR